ncbi:MAG: gliding motility-associated C-terminal domain-containing protein [Cytophagaceae bacterium]
MNYRISLLNLILFASLIASPFITKAQYCTPTFDNPCTWGNSISSFSINTLRNIGSGCNGTPNNYRLYTPAEFTTTLEQGSTYEVMVTPDGEATIRLFFDFNHDSDFDDAGEFFNLGHCSFDSTIYVPVTIPANASGNVRMRVRSAIEETISSTDDCDRKVWGETEDYTVSIVPPFNMYYTNASVSQETYFVRPGTTEQKIIGIELSTSGSLNPLTLKTMNFNTAGTTNPADIRNAKLFYTGQNRIFDTGTLFGSIVEAPNGSFSFSGSLTLLPDKNFFWLTYDIKDSATLHHTADASCTSIVLNAIEYFPEMPAPEGSREIYDFIVMKNGSDTVTAFDFYDDGGFDNIYSGNTYLYTIYPREAGKAIEIEFQEFDVCATEVGCDEFIIYNGSNTSEPIGTFYDMPPIIRSTAADGSLTFRFRLVNTYLSEETLGWKARVSSVSTVPSPPPVTTPPVASELKAPEGISPNNDSSNDFFVVEGIKPGIQVSLLVYTRDGGLVFSSNDYKNTWDGKNSAGDDLPDGTYYYVIRAGSEKIKNYVEIRR